VPSYCATTFPPPVGATTDPNHGTANRALAFAPVAWLNVADPVVPMLTNCFVVPVGPVIERAWIAAPVASVR
jgi:hypothetical protein